MTGTDIVAQNKESESYKYIQFPHFWNICTFYSKLTLQQIFKIKAIFYRIAELEKNPDSLSSTYLNSFLQLKKPKLNYTL